MSQGRPLPGIRVAALIDLIEPTTKPTWWIRPQRPGRRLLNGEDAVYGFPFRQARSFVRPAW